MAVLLIKILGSHFLLLTLEVLRAHVFVFSFRGCVTGPTFHFDVIDLEFGDVAFGELQHFLPEFVMLLPHYPRNYNTQRKCLPLLDSSWFSFSVGFPQTKTCTLYNTSSVPMTFALRFLWNGTGSPSVSSDQQVSDLSRKNWQDHTAQDHLPRPVEFTASPAAGTVPAMSDVTIKVQLIQYRHT